MSFLDNRFVKNTVKASGLILVSTSPYSCGNCDKNTSEPKIAPAPAPAPNSPAPASDSVPDSDLKGYGTEFYMDIKDFTSQDFTNEKQKYITAIKAQKLNDSNLDDLFGEALLKFKVEASNYFKKVNAFYSPKLRKELDKMDIHEKSIKLLSPVQDPDNSLRVLPFCQAITKVTSLDKYLARIYDAGSTIPNNSYIKNELKKSIIPICIELNKINNYKELMEAEAFVYAYKTDSSKFTDPNIQKFVVKLKNLKMIGAYSDEQVKQRIENAIPYIVQKWLETL